MARPRTLPDDHFCFSTFRKGDSTYVYGYRNEWDPEMSQDTVLEQHSLFRGTGYDFLNLVSRASPLFRETV